MLNPIFYPIHSEDESGKILEYIKSQSHVELRKENGYTHQGRSIISEEQFSSVLKNVATIIHDRDARLTDARFYSLRALCIALDDHNNYVKQLLLKSWFLCESLSSNKHLDMMKQKVDFNARIKAYLG